MRQIRYTLIWSDLLWWYARSILRRPLTLVLYVVLWGIVGLTSYADTSDGAPLWGYLLVSFGLGAGLFLAIQLIFAGITVLTILVLHFRKGIFCEHRLTLTEELLIGETVLARSEYRWDQISHFAKTRQYLLAHVAGRGLSRFLAKRAYIIPRRAFADQAEMDAFLEEMQALQAQSRPASSLARSPSA